MKGKIKKLLSSSLSALVALTLLAQPMYAMATEMDSNVSPNEVQYMDMIVNPYYADIVDEEALRAEHQEIRELREQISLYGVSSVHSTLDAAVAHLRAQMVERNVSIDVNVTYELYKSIDFSDMFYAAIEYSDACSGQEGDALKGVWSGYTGQITQRQSYVTLTYNITYYTTYEQEEALTEAVDAAILSLNLANDNEYTKVYKIYNYICDNVDYEYESEDMIKYTAYAAMCKKSAVCQGYALLFYRMCKEAGLSVRYINGSAGGAHAWNIVRIGDYYYNLDPTWDGQDVETRSNYFLKNMADFNDHIRRAEFLTAEFMTKFPMSNFSWTIPNKLSGSNYGVSFNTIDGTTISTTVSGRPKLLVFYSDVCLNSKNTINSISGADFSDVDIVAINTIKSDVDTVKAFKASYGNGNNAIIYTYDATYVSNNYLWNYARMGGMGDKITYPIIAYIDSNNIVRHVTSGYSGAETIRGNLKFYCGESVLLASEASKTLNEGDTYKIATYMNNMQVNNAQIVWNTSDSKVATVNARGVVTAVAGGTCTITGKLNDTYSVSVSVTVNQKLEAPQFTVANGTGGVQIDWDFVEGATGYIIYRREANGAFQKIASYTDGVTKSYVDKNVVNGTAYFYAVKAINSTTQSTYTTKGINYKAALAAPEFTVANVAGGVQIDWDFVEGATGYIVYRREANGVFQRVAGFTDGVTKSYVDTAVVNGTAYFYAVKAINSTSQSTYTTKGIYYKVALTIPQFTLVSAAGGVKIDWNFVEGATGYIVYRREAGGTFQRIAGFTDGVTKSYVDKDVVNGTAYFYAVKAINSTAQSSYTTQGIYYKAALAIPQFTVANAAGGVQVKWDFVEGATGYIVYRREAGGVFTKIAGYTDGVTKSYVDTDVVDGTAYFYAVKAISSTAQSTYTTKGINYKEVLATPQFTVVNTAGGVQIDWDFVDDATGYIVYRREANGTFARIASYTDGVTKSYVDTTAVTGTTYYYAVKAINSTKQSAYNSVEITP